MIEVNFRRHVNSNNVNEACTAANLFGKAYTGANAISPHLTEKGIHWRTFRDMTHSMKRLHMKIRPVDFKSQGEKLVQT